MPRKSERASIKKDGKCAPDSLDSIMLSEIPDHMVSVSKVRLSGNVTRFVSVNTQISFSWQDRGNRLCLSNSSLLLGGLAPQFSSEENRPKRAVLWMTSFHVSVVTGFNVTTEVVLLQCYPDTLNL